MNIPFYCKTQTRIYQTLKQNPYALWVKPSLENPDFCAICHNPQTYADLKNKFLALCAHLPLSDQKMLARQVCLTKHAYETQNFYVLDLNPKEKEDLKRIYEEFLPNIFKISDDCWFYEGYFLPKNGFEPSVFLYQHNLKKIFSPQTLNRIRQKDIIDAGGFLADSAIIFEKEFCDKTIYSFEPTQENFALMQQTLTLNHSTRIVPIHKGLGEKTENKSIRFDGGGGSSFVFDHGNNEKESVEIISLDDFVLENNLQIGFIKADVEGFEQALLKGAFHTICTQKPALLISLYHSEEDYFSIKPLIESWNLGYKMRIFKSTDLTLFHETALYCEVLDD